MSHARKDLTPRENSLLRAALHQIKSAQELMFVLQTQLQKTARLDVESADPKHVSRFADLAAHSATQIATYTGEARRLMAEFYGGPDEVMHTDDG